MRCWRGSTIWELPQCTDLFGQRGLGFLRRLKLKSAVDQKLLEEDLDLLGLLAVQIRGQEERIKNTNALDADTVLIQSLPGVGPILAAVAAAEINGIERFPTSARLCAYAGLIPSTHASGGTVYHGRLVKAANKWLRWAMIEAAWVAIGCSGSLAAFYRGHRVRGKQTNTAITIVARRMTKIIIGSAVRSSEKMAVLLDASFEFCAITSFLDLASHLVAGTVKLVPASP